MEIQSARRDLNREAGGHQQQRLLDIPVDAEYVGDGPMYAWNGSVWLDWNLWVAATSMRDPGTGGEELPGGSATPPGKRKPMGKAVLPLFKEEEEA